MAHPSCVLLTLATGFVLTSVGLGMSNLALTPSPDMPKWTVKDRNNNVCMLMAMDATLTSLLGEQYPVPQSAEAKPVSGNCGDANAYFTLSWSEISYPQFEINILFKRNGVTYKMDVVNGTERRSVSSFSSWSEQSSSFPSAAIGSSMTCDDFEVGFLYFQSYQFQPFAQQSSGEFGQGEQCSDGDLLLIVVIVVAVMFVLIVGAVIAIVVFLVLRRRRRNLNYSGVQ